MAKKQFKAESKKILDLMINSIYTNREIFLRELISNASDALDKLYFRSLTDQSVGLGREDFCIRITPDPDAGTLKIEDNGIGMTEQELSENLGTIAHSGSGEFVDRNQPGDEVDIIGRFGVGFYSAFMVADRIEVRSLAFGEQQAHLWVSSGADGFTITPAEKASAGTEITLHLKPDTDTENYSEFLDSYRIMEIVKRYSDYVRYPIRMLVKSRRLKEGSESEYEDYTEDRVLNSMVPLWRRDKKEITKQQYEEFFRDRFHAFESPLGVIHQKAEGTLNYQALLYIPGRADYNYYSREFKKGLMLYSRGVLITDCCEQLLPDCFSFVKGLVDTEDLSLNISRETLQQDHQVKAIAAALEKRIKRELLAMQKDRREDYETFWKAFGLNIKYALYSSFGAKRELLEDLLLFESSGKGGYVTLKEYLDSMPEGQKYIYYAAGSDLKTLASVPQAELVTSQGYGILCFTDDVDEFVCQMLGRCGDKEFRSITGGDLGLESDEQQQETEQKQQQHREMLEFMANQLEGKVSEVKVSSSLKSHPVCLTSKGPLSIEMEKVLGSMPGAGEVKAEKVLELNGSHRVFDTLCALWPEQQDKLARYTGLLYNQALMIEGLPLEDPLAFANGICELMV